MPSSTINNSHSLHPMKAVQSADKVAKLSSNDNHQQQKSSYTGYTATTTVHQHHDSLNHHHNHHHAQVTESNEEFQSKTFINLTSSSSSALDQQQPTEASSSVNVDVGDIGGSSCMTLNGHQTSASNDLSSSLASSATTNGSSLATNIHHETNITNKGALEVSRQQQQQQQGKYGTDSLAGTSGAGQITGKTVPVIKYNGQKGIKRSYPTQQEHQQQQSQQADNGNLNFSDDCPYQDAQPQTSSNILIEQQQQPANCGVMSQDHDTNSNNQIDDSIMEEEDEISFDYEPVLSKILSEKKLVSMPRHLLIHCRH